MTDRETGAMGTRDRRTELEQLIEAIDRRVPRVERSGEAQIAQDAAELRGRAVGRLTELDGKGTPA